VLRRACVRDNVLKVIGLIDCVGGGPHYLCTVKGHASTLWKEETHPYGNSCLYN
jgi:hypothetical protein